MDEVMFKVADAMGRELAQTCFEKEAAGRVGRAVKGFGRALKGTEIKLIKQQRAPKSVIGNRLLKERAKTWGARAAVATPVAAGGTYGAMKGVEAYKKRNK